MGTGFSESPSNYPLKSK